VRTNIAPFLGVDLSHVNFEHVSPRRGIVATRADKAATLEVDSSHMLLQAFRQGKLFVAQSTRVRQLSDMNNLNKRITKLNISFTS
jgi:hypothetical protein